MSLGYSLRGYYAPPVNERRRFQRPAGGIFADNHYNLYVLAFEGTARNFFIILLKQAVDCRFLYNDTGLRGFEERETMKPCIVTLSSI